MIIDAKCRAGEDDGLVRCCDSFHARLLLVPFGLYEIIGAACAPWAAANFAGLRVSSSHAKSTKCSSQDNVTSRNEAKCVDFERARKENKRMEWIKNLFVAEHSSLCGLLLKFQTTCKCKTCVQNSTRNQQTDPRNDVNLQVDKRHLLLCFPISTKLA